MRRRRKAECLFVIYHNVAFVSAADRSDLRGVREADFERQVAFLCRHYEPLTMTRLVAALDGHDRLPARCFYLTFDDGSSEHLAVAERLRAAKLEGAFFVNTKRLSDRRLLTVDKQRLLQYATPDFTEFLQAFCHAAKRLCPGDARRFELTAQNIKEAETFYAEFPFYSPPERFYRKIRDRWLTEAQVGALVDELFGQFFDNEAQLLRTYFMDWDGLRVLQSLGMHVGGHSHAHPLLSKLDAASQYADLQEHVEQLRKQLGVRLTAFAYPYGTGNEDTINILKQEGIRLAFIEDGLPQAGGLRDPYRLSRLGPEKLDILMEAADTGVAAHLGETVSQA